MKSLGFSLNFDFDFQIYCLLLIIIQMLILTERYAEL